MQRSRLARKTFWPAGVEYSKHDAHQEPTSGKPVKRILQRSDAGTWSVLGRPSSRMFHVSCS